MNQDDSRPEPETKPGKAGLPVLPANLAQLKTQLEQLATTLKAKQTEDPNQVAQRFGGR